MMEKKKLAVISRKENTKGVLLLFLGVLFGWLGCQAGRSIRRQEAEVRWQQQQTPPPPPPAGRDAAVSPTRSREESNTIVWLLSYPNSGTSYTTELIRSSTQLFTATNYGAGESNLRTQDGVSVRAFAQGPFLSHPSNATLSLPPSGRFVTKTHCSGYCVECGPDRYVVPLVHTFATSCAAIQWISKEQRQEKQRGHYDAAALVQGMIHLIRNPFDNVVARFHLNNERHDQRFSNDGQGFRQFCTEILDDAFAAQEEEAIFLLLGFKDKDDDDDELWKLYRSIPCRCEFWRWIQWHNHASQLPYLNLHASKPVMVLHYEDYETDFSGTHQRLLDFVRLEALADPTPFITGKHYEEEYFTLDERRAVRQLVKSLAHRHLWKFVERYFFNL